MLAAAVAAGGMDDHDMDEALHRTIAGGPPGRLRRGLPEEADGTPARA